MWVNEAPKDGGRRRWAPDTLSSGGGMRGSEDDVVISFNPGYNSANEMVTRARQRLIIISDVEW